MQKETAKHLEVMETSKSQKGRSHIQVPPLHDVEKKHKRAVANSNERRRMRSINNGFERLRSNLPQHDVVEKMSKANILLHACQYVRQLQEEYSVIIQKLQNPCCQSCGCSSYLEQSNHVYGTESQFPITFVPEQYTAPFSVESITDDESAEDKPGTPGSDAFNPVGSDDKSSVSSLSFSHLIQAVQVLHDKVGFPTSNVLGSPNSSATISLPCQENQPLNNNCSRTSQLNRSLIREAKDKKLPVDLISDSNPIREEHTAQEAHHIRYSKNHKRARVVPPKLMHKPYLQNPDDE